jgi:hypothetical protein
MTSNRFRDTLPPSCADLRNSTSEARNKPKIHKPKPRNRRRRPFVFKPLRLRRLGHFVLHLGFVSDLGFRIGLQLQGRAKWRQTHPPVGGGGAEQMGSLHWWAGSIVNRGTPAHWANFSTGARKTTRSRLSPVQWKTSPRFGQLRGSLIARTPQQKATLIGEDKKLCIQHPGTLSRRGDPILGHRPSVARYSA